MDIKLTDVQKKAGLSLENAGDGYYYLLVASGVSLCFSKDGFEIHTHAFAYTLGFLDGQRLEIDKRMGVAA